MRVRALGAALALVLARPATAADTCPITAGAGSVDAYLDAALAAKQRGENNAALSCLSRAYMLEQSAGLLHNMGRLFEDLGRYRQAAEAYRRLLADPAADPALREADAARLGALDVRLDRAWLVPKFPANVTVLNGRRALVAGAETDARPGPIILEVLTGDTVHLWRTTLPAGERTELDFPVEPTPDVDAIIDLRIRPRFLAIDGREVGASLATLARVRLEAGAHDLEWTDAQGHGARAAIAIAPGQTWILGSSTDAPLGSPWPWIAGGTTVALGTTSAIFFGLAESDRASIRGAAKDSRGVITGLTFAEAEVINERSADRTLMGAVLVGGAIASLGLTIFAAWITSP